MFNQLKNNNMNMNDGNNRHNYMLVYFKHFKYTYLPNTNTHFHECSLDIYFVDIFMNYEILNF